MFSETLYSVQSGWDSPAETVDPLGSICCLDEVESAAVGVFTQLRILDLQRFQFAHFQPTTQPTISGAIC